MDIMFDPSALGCIGGIMVGVCCALMAGALPGLSAPALAVNGGWTAALLMWLTARTGSLRLTALLGHAAGFGSAVGCLAYSGGIATGEPFSLFLSIAGLLVTITALPWMLGARYPLTAARLAAPVLSVCYWMFRPLTRWLDHAPIASEIAQTDPPQSGITEQTLRTLVTQVEGEGTINRQEKDLIHNVLAMDTTETHQIMTPRVDMFCLDFKTSFREALPDILHEGYSRIPVYDEQIDRIQGVVYVKDLLQYLAGNHTDFPLRKVMRPALFVTESLPANKLLQTFRDKHVHIALVVDEHGGIQGMLTIEDVLEELVGEIYDEKDAEERLIRWVNHATCRVLGKTSLEEVNRQLQLSLEERDVYETISGYVLHHLGFIPEKDHEFDVDNVTIRVERATDRRIQELIIIRH